MDERRYESLMDGIAQKNAEAIREHVKNETQELWNTLEAQGSELRKVGGSYSGAPPLSKIVADQKTNIKALFDGDKRSFRFVVPKTLVQRSAVSGLRWL